MRRTLVLLLFLTLTVPAAGRDVDMASLARAVVTGHIVPGFEALAAQTKRLNSKIAAACARSEPLTAPGLQQVFKDTLAAWMQVQHVRFGPAMRDDRFYRFQFWPDKHGQGAKQIRRRLSGPLENVPGKDKIASGSVALQGFPALERMLFDPNPVKAGQQAKVCKLASAIGFNLSTMATEAVAEWQSYSPEEPKTVVDAILRNMMEELQVIVSLKLTRPLGKTLDAARPRRAESWRSRMSFNNVKNNLAGLRDLLAGSENSAGLASVLPDEGETLGMRAAMIEQLDYGIERIEAHPVSLHEAVSTKEGREAVAFLISHIQGLRELLFEQLAPALGVNLGFNAQDGD